MQPLHYDDTNIWYCKFEIYIHRMWSEVFTIDVTDNITTHSDHTYLFDDVDDAKLKCIDYAYTVKKCPKLEHWKL